MGTQHAESAFDRRFDMSNLAAAMPQAGEPSFFQRPQQPLHGLGMMPMGNSFPMYNNLPDGQTANARQHTQNIIGWRQQMGSQPLGYVGGMGGFGFSGFQPRDSRPMPQASYQATMSPNGAGTDQRELRRISVPSAPRGPPRKPKRSGNALWVGNLPPFARIEELKDHFSTGATLDIESVFLISKSNCAFVNYRSELASINAMNRFHNSRFRGRSLVCRLRRTASSSGSVPTSPLPALEDLPVSSGAALSPAVTDEPTSPLIVGDGSPQSNDSTSYNQVDGVGSTVPAKFFILKSLTLEDLESSVTTRSWATQPHNEHILNKAFEEADEVFLIFSANKSGEYFGFARMTSPASHRADSGVGLTPKSSESNDSDAPRTIPTVPTATAPRGRIIDDSARGSIFWEADHADQIEAGAVERKEGESTEDGQFSIEWQSTTKIPFYQTRGMRNPWNGNREIKIARDGQELDPRVGRRLLQLFRTSPSSVDGGHSGLYN